MYNFTTADLKEMVQMYEVGKLTTPQIAEKYGCDCETIRQRLKEQGVTLRLKGWPKGKRRKPSEETKRKMSKAKREEKNYNWEGGISSWFQQYGSGWPSKSKACRKSITTNVSFLVADVVDSWRYTILTTREKTAERKILYLFVTNIIQ